MNIEQKVQNKYIAQEYLIGNYKDIDYKMVEFDLIAVAEIQNDSLNLNNCLMTHFENFEND